MLCPSCDGKTVVLATRKYYYKDKDFYYIERKRRCTKCNEKFDSIEISYETWATYFKEGEED